jgi:hypothetical protein
MWHHLTNLHILLISGQSTPFEEKTQSLQDAHSATNGNLTLTHAKQSLVIYEQKVNSDNLTSEDAKQPFAMEQ